MFFRAVTKWVNRFRRDEEGTITLEAVITLPLLVWALAFTWEFFELHRYSSVRDKATYTVADMISREMHSITPTYMDNAKRVFDTIANDTGQNQLRVTVVKYDADTDTYDVVWSEIRGPGPLAVMTDAQVRNAHDEMPIMGDGEQVIVMDTVSTYPPLFTVGVEDEKTIEHRILTSPRFAPQIVWEDS